CRILLEGVALDAPDDAALDRSPAMHAANRIVETWDRADDEEDERLVALRAAARTAFGRTGYDATTVRDIAALSGLSTGPVYRLVGSKEELLASIMKAFSARVRLAWHTVLSSESTAVEKLDALLWTNINVVDRFRDEYSIQLAWLRASPPRTA